MLTRRSLFGAAVAAVASPVATTAAPRYSGSFAMTGEAGSEAIAPLPVGIRIAALERDMSALSERMKVHIKTIDEYTARTIARTAVMRKNLKVFDERI